MKIQYASDLHLEFLDNKAFLKANPMQAVDDYRKLKVYCKNNVNYALLDKQINWLNSALVNAWKNNSQRSTPYGLLWKEILAKNRMK